MTPNQKTIKSYESHVQEYIDDVPTEVPEPIKKMFARALSSFPVSARVLEIGSGHGRDASYLQSMGYHVDCTDAVQGFVDVMRQKGLSARRLNIITDPINGKYDVVIAIGVLLHFTREEVRTVLQKIVRALNPQGAFVCTLQQGTGETWKDNKVNAPRYFCYWEVSQLKKLLKAAGFTSVRIEDNGTKWLQIIAVKK